MERLKLGVDREDIITCSTHIIDSIFPVVIKELPGNKFAVLFEATENASVESAVLLDESDTTGGSLFFQLILQATTELDLLIARHRVIYENNIEKDKDAFDTYMRTLAKLNGRANDIYNCSFDMVEMKDKPYFATEAYKVLYTKDGVNRLEKCNLMLTRDIFVRLSIYLIGFNNPSYDDESVFINTSTYIPHFEFMTADRVKLHASTLDNKTVLSHYTVGKGPSEIAFTYISKHIDGKILRNPMGIEPYTTFYCNDIILSRMIYDNNSDTLYLVLNTVSSVTGKQNKTKVVRLSKELYDKSNFLDSTKIYKD